MQRENVLSMSDNVPAAVSSTVVSANTQNEGDAKFRSELGKRDPVFHPCPTQLPFSHGFFLDALVEISCKSQSQI